MRRMLNPEEVITKPVLIYEQELTNESSVNIDLKPGTYLIELHGKNCTNSSIIKITEDAYNVSTACMFNVAEAGANLGYWQYDTSGQLLETYDGVENNITVSGHVDIYKF